jgi:hypothetical protein
MWQNPLRKAMAQKELFSDDDDDDDDDDGDDFKACLCFNISIIGVIVRCKEEFSGSELITVYQCCVNIELYETVLNWNSETQFT